jgi:hypothetical protein
VKRMVIPDLERAVKILVILLGLMFSCIIISVVVAVKDLIDHLRSKK